MEVGRNPVSKHQIQLEYGDEQADAGRDHRTRLARPNSQARTRTGNINFPCSADHEQAWQPYLVGPYSCYMCGHTYIHSQNSLLIYPHFGIESFQPPRLLNSEEAENVTLDRFLSSLLNIVQTSDGQSTSNEIISTSSNTSRSISISQRFLAVLHFCS